jgi:hypothetical protein
MRVSVGIEERALLLRTFEEALKAVDRDAESQQLWPVTLWPVRRWG